MFLKSDYPGYALVKESVPYHGKGLIDLGRAIANLAADGQNKYVQRIVVAQGDPHIRLEKLVPESEVPNNASTSFHDVIRNRSMVEYPVDLEKNSINQLWEIFDLIHGEGLFVNSIAIGRRAEFQKWLGLRLHLTRPNFFGIPIKELTEVPHDTFFVCGTPEKESDIDEVRLTIKASIP